MLIPNWSDYFKYCVDNEKGDQNISIYSSVWDQDKDHAAKLSLLTNDPNTIILEADAEGTITPLHNFSNPGGSLLCPSNKIMFLIGSGHVGIGCTLHIHFLLS